MSDDLGERIAKLEQSLDGCLDIVERLGAENRVLALWLGHVTGRLAARSADPQAFLGQIVQLMNESTERAVAPGNQGGPGGRAVRDMASVLAQAATRALAADLGSREDREAARTAGAEGEP